MLGAGARLGHSHKMHAQVELRPDRVFMLLQLHGARGLDFFRRGQAVAIGSECLHSQRHMGAEEEATSRDELSTHVRIVVAAGDRGSYLVAVYYSLIFFDPP